MASVKGVTGTTCIATISDGVVYATKSQGKIVNTYGTDGDMIHSPVLSIHEHNTKDTLLLLVFKDKSSLICTRGTEFIMANDVAKRADCVVPGEVFKTSFGDLALNYFSFYRKSVPIYTMKLLNTENKFVELDNGTYACIGE